MINTPAIYGHGTADDRFTLATDRFVWTGRQTIAGSMSGSGDPIFASTRPGAIVPDGPGTGAGVFDLRTREIVIGFPELSQPFNAIEFNRLMLGFSEVNFYASEQITSNNRNSLTVWRTGVDPSTAFDPVRYAGIDRAALNLVTPLLTGDSGSSLSLYASGALRIVAPEGTSPAATDTVATLGATLSLRSMQSSVQVDTAVALPSGRLDIMAQDLVEIDGSARIDLSGRTIPFVDIVKHSWGGDVALESLVGDILVAEGATIDVSAANSDAGTIAAIALHSDAGHVRLDGTLRGAGGDGYDGGAIDIRAQAIGDSAASLSGDFAALNTRLDEAGFSGGRSFAFKQGDLVVDGLLRAQEIGISVDGGSLTVNGVIDSSGFRPGAIRLAARDDLTIAGGALLDAHGTVLQVDGDGKAIDAKNRAHVELTSAEGWLRLQSGARIDLSAPDGVARGELALNVGRTSETSGDARIDAGGTVNIAGANTIMLNAFWRYSPTDDAGTIMQDNGSSEIVNADGALGLNQIDSRNAQFFAEALGNSDLSRRTAGLSAYGDAYHLRPGVEITSNDTPGGNLTVSGDIDLSGYRYGPDADRDSASAKYGVGEALALTIRAEHNLTVNGSISDGFGPAAEIPPRFSNLVGDISQSELFVETDFWWGGTGYASDQWQYDVLYLVNDWTIPQTPFYEAFAANSGYTDGNTYQRYNPGETIPAGTPLLASWGGLGFEIGDNAIPELAGGIVPGIPAQPATSRLARLLGEGTQSASIRLVAGADLAAADTRATQQRAALASYYVPGSSSFSGIIDDIASSDQFFLGDYSWVGSPASGYATNVPMYMLEAWTVPSTDLYLNGLGGLSASDGQWFAPGDTIPAGTQLANPVFDASVELPRVATGIDVVAPLDGRGHLVLNDPHSVAAAQPLELSVVRTGTGNLDLIAALDLSQATPFGVYTAGSAVDVGAEYSGVTSQGAFFAEDGGDIRITAGRTMTGYIFQRDLNSNGFNNHTVSNWLVRQGDQTMPAAWGIRFAGFSGFGALGGGNLTVKAGGDAGVRDSIFEIVENDNYYGSSGLIFAVGSSGRVTSVASTPDGAVIGGTLVQTGGGDIAVDIGGRLNPTLEATRSVVNDHYGSFTAVRGDIDVRAGAIGNVPLLYGVGAPNDQRAFDPYVATRVQRLGGIGGPVVVVGDGAASLRSRGDLVLGGAGDPGMIRPVGANNAPSFSLWKRDSAIRLLSAGGNLVPWSVREFEGNNQNQTAEDNSFARAMLPPILEATAADGSIYSAGAKRYTLAPSADGYLEFLAKDSIQGAAFATSAFTNAAIPGAWSVSGAQPDANSIPNPFLPGTTGAYYEFQPDTAFTNLHAGDDKVIRLYAMTGDIVNFTLGDPTPQFVEAMGGWQPRYSAAMPARIIAGRDIVNFGKGAFRSNSREPEVTDTPSLILNNDVTDVSLLSAGRDIFYANVQVAGPGTLEISAGRNIYQGGNSEITSIGGLAEGDTRLGASIAVMAGMGQGIDWGAIRSGYLDPGNLADPERPLADPLNEGKVAKVYDEELADWLEERFAFTGNGEEALAYFDALAPEQQRIFLRDVYYAELKAGGREYSGKIESGRFGSYLRGRQMIETLFPERDGDGAEIVRTGSYTAFGGSGIQTLYGGNIEILAPGGQIVIGVTGEVPPASSGLITQGSGNISLYSQESILLGLSRIMTTFGGSIIGWSAEGDINAGRGSKTTLVYTPPRRVYDAYGNVTLSPQVPSSGAGIATLNPIPEVPAGDIDLIAPLGTIDAGEAGIRVSGDINLAALQVLNAANIQVQGEATGIPVVAQVNTGALTAASAATSAVANQAAELAERSRPEPFRDIPMLVTVTFAGFGEP